jgi:hypothetical protein
MADAKKSPMLETDPEIAEARSQVGLVVKPVQRSANESSAAIASQQRIASSNLNYLHFF